MARQKEFNAKQYLNEKVKVLAQLGMTNKAKVKAYLESATSDISNDYQKEIKLDQLARTMINDYFNGSSRFVITLKEEGKHGNARLYHN